MQCGFQQEGEKKPPGISTDLAIKGTKDVETMQTLHVYSVRDKKVNRLLSSIHYYIIRIF
jgi:hypothetical protein